MSIFSKIGQTIGKLFGSRTISVDNRPASDTYPTDVPIEDNAFIRPPTGPNTTIDFAKSQTRAQRINDPGALKFANQPNARSNDGFAEFTDYNSGRKALEADLNSKFTGAGKTGLGPESTISDFVHVYAPKNENDVKFYTKMLTDNLSTTPDAKLGQFQDKIPQFADIVEVIEGYRKPADYQAKQAAQKAEPKQVVQKPFSMVGETIKQFFTSDAFNTATKQLSDVTGYTKLREKTKPIRDFFRPDSPEEAAKQGMIRIGGTDADPTYLDVTGFVGELKPIQEILGSLGKKALTKIAESKAPEEILGILKSGMKGLSDDFLKPLAERLKSSGTVEEVGQTIKTFTEDLSKGIESLSKNRGFVDTVKNAPKTAPEVAQGVKGSYTPITNPATLDEARSLINSNLDEAVRIARSGEPATAKSNTIAQLLIDKFQQEGRFQDAIDIVENTAKKATSQGQAIQALSMYNRLTPEGVLKYTQRLMNRASEATGKTLKLTEEAAKDIVGQAKKAQALPDGSREKIVETAKLVQKITNQIPSTTLDKISFIQTLFQLLNPKTAVRNIIGNAGFGAIENVKDVLAAAIDSPLSFITGKRTKTLPSLFAQFKGAKEGFVLGVEDALKHIDTSMVGTQFDLPKTDVFKNKVGQKLEMFLNLELKAPDRAFYQAAYDGSLYQQMKAAGVSVATDAMKEVAHYDALYRTFQDNSVSARIFTGLKKALNFGKSFGLGDFLLKYPKTPGNILARGIDYSPAGFINTIFEAVKPLVGKPFDQKAFVESFSRASTGTTALVGTGALLHRLGLISGRPDSDIDVRGLERTTGLGRYQINTSGMLRFIFSGFDAKEAKLQPGDRLISYDWFQPQAIGISIGANIDEGNGEGGTVMDVIQKAILDIPNTLSEGVNTLAEQPLISGLTRALKQKDFATSILETIKGIPASFVPTLLNQINQLFDNSQRLTYDPSKIKYGINLAKAKIPGLAQTLPVQESVLGQDLEKYQGGSNNPFNVLFNPAFVNSFTPTPEAQLVLDLMNETGDKTQFPRTVSYTQKINGENIKLSPTQVSALQHYVGTITRDLFHSFATDPTFQELAPEEKTSYLQNVLTDVGSAGRIVILGNRPAKVSQRVQNILERYHSVNP